MKIILHLQNIGFNVQEPDFEFMPITSNMLTGISSRDFGLPYEDMHEQICGNLYLWLQQSYGVLWRVEETEPKVLIYKNTTEKLGERFGTLSRLTKEDGKAASFEMVKALALSNYIIEHAVYKMEGNWLLKYRNPNLNGLLNYFLFWLAQQELADNDCAQKCLLLFIKKFAKDVDLSVLQPYQPEMIMDSFIRSFFLGQNELSLVISMLEQSNTTLYEQQQNQ